MSIQRNYARTQIKIIVQLPILPLTVNPPHRITLKSGVITFTRLASHIYDLSISNLDDKCHFIGRIEQKSDCLWAVTYIDCRSCIPEYFDDWQQATLFLIRLNFYK